MKKIELEVYHSFYMLFNPRLPNYFLYYTTDGGG